MSGMPRAKKFQRSLCCVFVEINLIRLCNNFAIRVVATGGTDVMGTLQFAAIRTFIWIARNQRIVRTTIIPARAGDFTLWDSHVTTSVLSGFGPEFDPVQMVQRRKKPP